KRSRKSCSLNSMVRLAANFGIVLLRFLNQQSVHQRDGGGGVNTRFGQGLEFRHIVQFGTHGNVGDALQDQFDHNRHAELFHPCTSLFNGRLDVFGFVYTDGLATQTFHHGDVIHTITFGFRGVDVVKGQLYTIVHLEATLCLTDQTQVGVVDQNMDVRQLELRAYGQLFNHELEVVVARNGHHFTTWVSGNHAQCGGNGPAQWACLTAVDPVTWLVHVQELGGSNLRQTNGADVGGRWAKGAVHFFVNALRLQGYVVKAGLALQGGFALLAIGNPGGTVAQLAGSLVFFGHFNEQLQCSASVRGNAQIRAEYATDLCGFDIH